MVDQDPHAHTSFVGADQGIEQLAGDLVHGHDVELEVHVVRGAVHVPGHPGHGIVIVGEDLEVVTAHHGQGTQVLVQLRGGAHPFRVLGELGPQREALGGVLLDHVVHPGLLGHAFTR